MYRRLKREIDYYFHLLMNKNIALMIYPVIEQNIARGVIRLSYPSIRPIVDRDMGTTQIYCSWVESNSFSAILFDGALLQITYDVQNDNIIGHRLLYYPCPYNLDLELLQDNAVLDVISLYNVHTCDIRLRTPFRFDFNAGVGSQHHPITHLTVNQASFRWAIARPLSFGHFIKMVFKLFYPDLWNKHEFIQKWPEYIFNRTITTEEEKQLFIEIR